MRLVAIIQARMGSSRLPGKVLIPLAGIPVLRHVIRRVIASNVFDDVVVATSTEKADDSLAATVKQWGTRTIRGSEADVLGRFGMAAQATQADAIVRITADCPLIDPEVLRTVAEHFCTTRADLVTNARARTFPRGLDAELFTRDALDIMLNEATATYQREHVTPFLYEHPERFNIVDVVDSIDRSFWRLTLDTPEDLALLTKIFEASDLEEAGPRLSQVVALIERHPEWLEINTHIEQKRIKEA